MTIPVFFDKFLVHTMPFADVLPWDEISVTLDFNDIFEGNLNALDELSKQFNVEQALAMARKASAYAIPVHHPLLTPALCARLRRDCGACSALCAGTATACVAAGQ